MTKPIHRVFITASILAAIACGLQAANPTPGYIDFGNLAPADSGAEFVEVNVNTHLITMASRLAAKAEPQVAELLQGLKGIRVNVIGLNEGNQANIEERIKAIRAQLNTDGWERVVTAQQKKEDVSVYMKTRGPEAVEGIFVLVRDGRKQAVLVNVVGDIRPEKLAMLGERFNIEPLKKLGGQLQTKDAEEPEGKN